MTCRDCLHYIDSAEANKPRYGLAGYGYCKAGATPELRAMFFPETQAVCLFLPSLFKEMRKPNEGLETTIGVFMPSLFKENRKP